MAVVHFDVVKRPRSPPALWHRAFTHAHTILLKPQRSDSYKKDRRLWDGAAPLTCLAACRSNLADFPLGAQRQGDDLAPVPSAKSVRCGSEREPAGALLLWETYPFVQTSLAVEGRASGDFSLQNQVPFAVEATGVQVTTVLAGGVDLREDEQEN